MNDVDSELLAEAYSNVSRDPKPTHIEVGVEIDYNQIDHDVSDDGVNTIVGTGLAVFQIDPNDTKLYCHVNTGDDVNGPHLFFYYFPITDTLVDMDVYKDITLAINSDPEPDHEVLRFLWNEIVGKVVNAYRLQSDIHYFYPYDRPQYKVITRIGAKEPEPDKERPF